MRLYFDTSVFSAYVDDRFPERMAATRLFWGKIGGHELYCSTLTMDEISHAAVLADADILFSWNFEHLVKRGTRLLVNYVNSTRGLRAIEILAPPEL